MPWQLPAELPPAADLRDGVKTLEAQLERVDKPHVAYCLSKLLVGFNERKTPDEVKLLLAVWIEACGDIPNDLWSSGVIELLQTHKFGMPKPVHLREAVGPKLKERQTALQRAREMLDKAADKPATADFQREPQEWRLRSTIWRGWEFRVGIRTGFLAEKAWSWAKRDERALAAIENREPAGWAIDEPGTVTIVNPDVAKPISPAMAAQQRKTTDRLAELARKNRGAPEPETIADVLDDLPPVDDYGHLATG